MTESSEKIPLIPGWAWPWVVVGLLSLNIGVCAVTVVYAVSNPARVEDDYYEKALAWDELKAELIDADTLGWTVEATLTAGMIDVTLLDRQGEPVPASVVAGNCFHLTHAGRRIDLRFTLVGDGRFIAPAAMARPGNWEIRLEITTPEVKARAVHHLEVVAGG